MSTYRYIYMYRYAYQTLPTLGVVTLYMYYVFYMDTMLSNLHV
jgi:hypothetical protein